MKKITIFPIILLLLIFSIGCQKETQEISFFESQYTTVYITRTGECYHKSGCQYLAQSQYAFKLSEVYKRYRACSVCKPPIVKLNED